MAIISGYEKELMQTGIKRGGQDGLVSPVVIIAFVLAIACLMSLPPLKGIAVSGGCGSGTQVESVKEGMYLFSDVHEMAALKGGRWLAAADAGSQSIKIVDTQENEIVRDVYVECFEPYYLAPSADGQRLFASSPYSSEIAVIDISSDEPSDWMQKECLELYGASGVDTSVLSLSGIGGPIAWGGGRLYFAVPNHLFVLNGTSGEVVSGASPDSGHECRIPVDLEVKEAVEGVEVSGEEGEGAKTGADGTDGANRTGYVFVSCEIEKAVLVYKIDKNANSGAGKLDFVKSITVGDMPQGIFLTNSGKRLYVANSNEKSVTVIDANDLGVISHITDPNIMKSPIAFSQSGDTVWVLDSYLAHVFRIDNKILAVNGVWTGQTGPYPVSIVAIQSDVNDPSPRLYVGGAGDIKVIDTEGDLRIYTKKGDEAEFTMKTDMILFQNEEFELKVRGGRPPFRVEGQGGLVCSEKDGDERLFMCNAPSLEGEFLLTVTEDCEGRDGKSYSMRLKVGGELSISPAEPHLELGGLSEVFYATGGFPPYRWRTETGHLSSGMGRYVVYTPWLTGIDTVTVTDAAGQRVSAKVTVEISGIVISPAVSSLIPEETRRFYALGGSNYTWSAPLGGELNATEGQSVLFTAPMNTGKYDLIVEDALNGESAHAVINVIKDELTITPESAAIEPSQSQLFSVSGGVPPYSWTADQGDLSSTKGDNTVYIAPERAGEVSIKVYDAGGRVASARIKVLRGLYITPVAPVVNIGEKVTLRALGGAGELLWGYTDGELTEKGGKEPQEEGVKGDEAEFSADRSGRFIVWVKEKNDQGEIAQAVVRVVSDALSITPGHAEVMQGEAVTFKVTGGAGPYAWSASHGILSTSSGDFVIWRAPDAIPDGDVMITVEDGTGRQQAARVKVTPQELKETAEDSENGQEMVSDKDMETANPILTEGEYHYGDTLTVNIPNTPQGIAQYVAIGLPDGSVYLFTGKNIAVPFEDNELPMWHGGDTVIDITLGPPFGVSLPAGKYTVYLLQIEAGLDPLTNLDAWRLWIQEFNVII